MTRKIYRDPTVERELEEIIMNLKQLRKHQYHHFRLGALVELQHATECIGRALNETQLSPKYVEEVGGDLK
jgi:glucosamine 6-phosphate synthetase-like amidotransferase/phosphosugar isomerase protein